MNVSAMYLPWIWLPFGAGAKQYSSSPLLGYVGAPMALITDVFGLGYETAAVVVAVFTLAAAICVSARGWWMRALVTALLLLWSGLWSAIVYGLSMIPMS